MTVSIELFPTVIYSSIRGFDKAGLDLVRCYYSLLDLPKAASSVVSAASSDPASPPLIAGTFPPILSIAVRTQQQSIWLRLNILARHLVVAWKRTRSPQLISLLLAEES
jgi:hypothetical protein